MNRPIVSADYRPIPIIGFFQSIGRYFSTKKHGFSKKKGVPENLEAVKTKIYLKLEDILIDENANQSESPQMNVIEN